MGLLRLEGCTVLNDGGRQPERYEPLPGILDLPGWLWRRMPAAAKVALVAAVVALIGVAIAIAPDIRESKAERERAERAERLKARAEREARIRREQRPVFVDARQPTSGVAGRRALLAHAADSVLRDARRRGAAGTLPGPIIGMECETFPRSVTGVGAEDSTKERFGRYFCLAITAEFRRSEVSVGGQIGHPYRVRIDFADSSYAFCKVVGRPGEAQLKRRFGPTVPQVCGGGP